MPGKAHMPRLHHRIKDHLLARGFTESQAWAIAVSSVAKGCATGDVNFPGHQSMNAISRAEYCKAFAEWKRNHSGTGVGANPAGRG